MLEVKKCGKTDFGYWALGTLKYKGLEVKSIFSLNKEVEANNSYQVKSVIVNNSRNGIMTFKVEI